MLKRTLAAAAIFAAIAMPAFAGSPNGTFNVVGTNPGGAGSYKGTVTVTATGAHTFRVVWHIGPQSMTSTGLWVDEKFSVGYQGDSIAVYTDQGGDKWTGHWANGTATQTGTETWTR